MAGMAGGMSAEKENHRIVEEEAKEGRLAKAGSDSPEYNIANVVIDTEDFSSQTLKQHYLVKIKRTKSDHS